MKKIDPDASSSWGPPAGRRSGTSSTASRIAATPTTSTSTRAITTSSGRSRPITAFQQYGGKKPIWSTELGLNAQGMTRHAVAVEMVKKFTVFFAAGGSNASWFDLLYPDSGRHGRQQQRVGLQRLRLSLLPLRTEAGCRSYYNMVNAICIRNRASGTTRSSLASAYLAAMHSGLSGGAARLSGGSTPISSATATGSACRCSGPTRAAWTWACRWQA